MSPSTKNSSRLKSAKTTSQSSDTRHMAMIGEKLLDLGDLAYVRRFRSLSNDPASVGEGESTESAIGLYGLERLLSYELLPDEGRQQPFLERLQAELQNHGLLERFVVLPDGALIRPELIKWADHGAVGRGHVVRLYGSHSSEKSLVTCLLDTRENSLDFLNTLARRLTPSSK